MKKLLVIVGPTSTGKTDLALELAKKFGGELISADSRQIYQGMDIGTGKLSVNSKHAAGAAAFADAKVKIKKAEGYWVVDGIKIHLYDLIKPDENYSVAEFQQEAYKSINEIQSRRKLPILVGGTGLYVQAVVEGLKIPKVPPEPKLREKLERKTTETLLTALKEVDQVTYQTIDQANRRRIIRALEVYHSTGETISSQKTKFKVGFDVLIIGLTSDRQELYRKADQRIESWFASGKFQSEVKELLKRYSPSLPSFTSLGYQDMVSYIEKRISLNEAIQRTSFKHHGFIKRQLTWFRKMKNIRWYDIKTLHREKLVKEIEDWLGKAADA
ncbi:MAG: hypothetical protein A3F35_02270 [Candidatus Woykebacteria bacterium RIFCSPHIGHO2_12_FULL_45_10]|uniref:tRNA dimethylallyltransferase n=1 Tax=Candidatus Woykebacteria bacterium RIFCSPHIGHO2_12_FULL_45_10 TaxID=1802603 RepID=A0A1G1WPR1_9BACT|nr:MAG: hypothetical protein A3F35_02270 [Candidatus Woykebacteria bacterium RIFCSPHIGHO2_12_FULL_45_10]